MNKLQQRRQSHRRRQEAINNLRKAGRAAATIILLWLMWQLPATKAYFTDVAETEPVTFRATTFADNLAIYPGKSQTNNSPGNPGPAFNVAQIVSGQIYLDFGTYPAGNNRNFPQVLILKNISADRHLTIEWHFSGTLAALMEAQEGALNIAPGEVSNLGFKLDTDPKALPGVYTGALHLSSLDGFITAEIPASLHLAEKSDKDKKDKNNDKDDSCKIDDDKDNNSKNGKDENQHNTCRQTVTGAVYGPQDDKAAKDSKDGKKEHDAINAAPGKAGSDPAAPAGDKGENLPPQTEAGAESNVEQPDAKDSEGIIPDAAQEKADGNVEQNNQAANKASGSSHQADSGGETVGNSNH